MNKNHITRLLILLIALQISSCTADDSSVASNSSKPDMLKQQLDKNDASLLSHYLQQHYPQGSNIKPLITDLKHIGAKVEKKSFFYKDEYSDLSHKFIQIVEGKPFPVYEAYIINYTNRQLSWWQRLTDVVVVNTKLIFRVEQQAQQLNYQEFLDLPWRNTNPNELEESYYRGCCHALEITPIYQQLDVTDYDTPTALQTALLHFFPIGSSFQSVHDTMIAQHGEEFFYIKQDYANSSKYYYTYETIDFDLLFFVPQIRRVSITRKGNSVSAINAIRAGKKYCFLC